jgi:hypothetical protein
MFNNLKLVCNIVYMYVYIHICCINNWKDIFEKLLLDIKLSKLYDKVKKIRCNILTTNKDDLHMFYSDKIEIIGISSDLNLYETSTINLLYEHSKHEDFEVLYIHTKGVRHNNSNLNVTDWVNYLSYFNIYKHEICISHLKEYDAVGVNLKREPNSNIPIHFSGNFWWSKSSYIKTLQKCEHTCYNSPEFWVTSMNNGKYLSLWESNINHYEVPYKPSQYTV